MNDEIDYDAIDQDKKYLADMIDKYSDKCYTFEDGDSIKVFQIKSRGPGQHLVSYVIQQGPGLPRKLVMTLGEFIDTYGHLFDPSLTY